MKNFYLFIVGLLLIMTSTSVLAEWSYVGHSEESIAYADKSTIRKNGNRVKMWVLHDLASPHQVGNGKPFLSTKGLHEYDCVNESSRGINLIEYSGYTGDGEVVWSGGFNVGFRPIVPETVEEMLWKVACGKK